MSTGGAMGAPRVVWGSVSSPEPQNFHNIASPRTNRQPAHSWLVPHVIQHVINQDHHDDIDRTVPRKRRLATENNPSTPRPHAPMSQPKSQSHTTVCRGEGGKLLLSTAQQRVIVGVIASARDRAFGQLFSPVRFRI